MKWPPLWKIKRELSASQDQLQGIALRISAPFWRSRYEKRELLSLKIHQGERPLAENLVVYLIYQPHGVADSILISLDYLISQRHEVLLVSNTPLSEEDLKKLKKSCWRIIERPNIGYDFGGYLCGLNHLRENSVSPAIVTLINDSIWFPIIPNNNIISQTELLISDFGGAVGLQEKGRNRRQLVLSYWVTITGKLFRDNIFWNFWRNYIPTSNKSLTVKLGERGLSKFMHAQERNFETLYNTDSFIAALRGSNFEKLKLTLKYASFTDSHFKIECDNLLATANESEHWRISCTDFAVRVTKKRNFLHSFPYASIALLQVPFIKKNSLRLQVLMRAQYLLAVQNKDLPAPDPRILSEIRRSMEGASEA
jgi:hypothetical protein